MATQQECEEYPDIFRPIPSGTPKDEAAKLKADNDRNERLYLAVRQVLKRDFDFKDRIPEEPQNFPGQLSTKDKAQFTAILGIIHADNWEDPSNGKTAAGPDDIIVRGDAKNENFIIDARFVEAVVDAVKEYTASSDLFNNVYALMRDEASVGVDSKSRNAAKIA
jgi:hypothetical protein